MRVQSLPEMMGALRPRALHQAEWVMNQAALTTVNAERSRSGLPPLRGEPALGGGILVRPA